MPASLLVVKVALFQVGFKTSDLITWVSRFKLHSDWLIPMTNKHHFEIILDGGLEMDLPLAPQTQTDTSKVGPGREDAGQEGDDEDDTDEDDDDDEDIFDISYSSAQFD